MPDPALSDKALAWIAPYQTQQYLVFQDSMGSIDSLQVSLSSETEFCGGDECGSDCEVEIAVLTSTKDPQLQFSIRATLNTEVQINSHWVFDGALYGVHNTERNDLMIAISTSSGSVQDNYNWNGLTTRVMTIICLGDVECPEFPMREMLVSREYGLIKYVAGSGDQWEQMR